MDRHTAPVVIMALLLMAGAAPLAAGLPGQEDDDALQTTFAILVGFPSGEEDGGGGELLVPGTVIPLAVTEEGQVEDRSAAVERSLSYTRAVSNLWDTFRLDPNRRIQQSQMVAAVLDQPLQLPRLPDSDVVIMATLLSFRDDDATFRIVFRQGERSLADSTVTVDRGGRAVVGGMDGEAAPYIFLFIEPIPPLPAGEGAVRFRQGIGITEPAKRHTVRPDYPEEARQAELTGVVVLDVLIDTDGQVRDVIPLQNPAPILTEAAVASVRQWRFEPARSTEGIPVKVRYVLTVKFDLK